MRHFLAVIIALILVAALPAVAQPSTDAAPCDVLMADCCGGAPAAPECPPTDCAGAGVVLLVELVDGSRTSRVSDSPAAPVARPIAWIARAPDTAPPKFVV